MKKLFKVFLGVMFLGSAAFAMADELVIGNERHDDHDRAKVVVVAPVHHRHHYYHPRPKAVLVINAGDHHDDHRDDHHDDHH